MDEKLKKELEGFIEANFQTPGMAGEVARAYQKLAELSPIKKLNIETTKEFIEQNKEHFTGGPLDYAEHGSCEDCGLCANNFRCLSPHVCSYYRNK